MPDPEVNRDPEPLRFLGYGRQSVRLEDLAAVRAVLESDWLTQGPAGPAFEQALAEVAGAASGQESPPHEPCAELRAVALASGTAALELTYQALGLGPEKRLVTSANTFLATATAALRLGAEVEFVDVTPDTGNLDLAALAARLAAGPRVDVVAPVHFAGRPVDMRQLLALRAQHGFEIVEDACHALGARWSADGRDWHPGAHPDVAGAVFSFHPVKHITTGEGGALVTRRHDLADHVARLAAHGVERAPAHGPGGEDPPVWYAPMVELGTNARLSDLQAALGTSQLARLGAMLARRRELAQRYDRALAAHTWLARPELLSGHAWHLYVVRVLEGERDGLMAFLRERRIGTQVHYWPVPANPWFLDRARARGTARETATDVPRALEHGRTALSLPLFPDLSDADQDRVTAALDAWARTR